MQFKNIYIAFSICFAIFFKWASFDFVLLGSQNDYFAELYANNQLYKVARKRIYANCSILCIECNAIKEEQAFIEKPETEDTQKLLSKFKLPLLSFLATYLASCKSQVKASLLNFLNLFPSSEERLSISVLRL